MIKCGFIPLCDSTVWELEGGRGWKLSGKELNSGEREEECLLQDSLMEKMRMGSVLI